MSKFTFVSFIFSAAFVFVYVQCQQLDQARSVAQECKIESGASDDDIEAMFRHELADSTESKCLRACIFKKFDMMNDEGKLKKDSFMKFMTSLSKSDEEKAALVEIIEECVALETAEDHCDAAAEYQMCFIKQANEKGVTLPDI